MLCLVANCSVVEGRFILNGVGAKYIKYMSKQKFKSKGGFILASIGAAVGLGNALRFPGLCAKYGGGAYLLIYFCALIILGIPMLNAELALGRKFGGGAPKCLESLKRGAGRIGWASCVNSLVTGLIYAGLAGWILTMAIKIAPLAAEAHNLSQNEIANYFFDGVLKARSDGVISGMSPLVFGGIAVALCAIFFCLRGGAGALAKAAKITVTVPVILLAFMAGRGLLYGNSATALRALFVPDFSKLSSPELWISALGQVFFSLSIVVGIMPAYGAYLPEGTNIFSCSLIIAAADFFVSVLASVVLFTTLYGCGLQGEIGQSGIITAFAVYPAAITQLFGGRVWLNAAAGIAFYASLAMIAIQAAVSMLEAFVAPFSEAFMIKRGRLAALVCVIGAGICAVFATTAGAAAVEISDAFINFYNILILGIAECVVFALGGKKSVALAGEINRFTRKLKMPEKFFGISVRILSPSVLSALTCFEVYRLVTNGLAFPLWLQICFGWGLSFIVFAAALIIARRALSPVPYKFRKPLKSLKINKNKA